MLDVIKEYMIKLGVKVDDAGYNNFVRSLARMDRAADSAAARMAKGFLGAAGVVAGALAAVNATTAGIIQSAAAADLGYQKLARRMWITEGSARAMSKALKAMNETMDDVAWTPELNAQYRELAALSGRLVAPAEFSGQMRYVRSVGFEVTKLKLTAASALEWISYYLVKYLGEPLRKIKTTLASLNDYLARNMPDWTRKAAKGLYAVYKAGAAVIRLVETVALRIGTFWERLPQGVRRAATLIGAAAALLMAGPLGWMTAGLTALVLLLDDFFAYIDGRESSAALAPVWEKVVFVLKWIDELLLDVNQAIEDFSAWLSKTGAVDGFTDAVVRLGDGFGSLGQGIAHVARETKKWFDYIAQKESFKLWWSSLGEILEGVLKTAASIVGRVGDVAKLIGLLLKGEYRAALDFARETQKIYEKEYESAADWLTKTPKKFVKGLFGIGWDTAQYFSGSGFDYRPGAGGFARKDGADIESIRPETRAALDYAAQAYKAVFGKELMVTSGTDSAHAGGTYSHANGWKLDITDGWDNNLMAENPKLRQKFIALLKEAGIAVRDEYILTNGENWTAGHLDLSAEKFKLPEWLTGDASYAQNFQPAASGYAQGQGAVTYVEGETQIIVNAPEGMSVGALAEEVKKKMDDAIGIKRVVFMRDLTQGAGLTR
jgi:hypothetical protein